MLKTTTGVVLRERFVGENDKYIDFLSRDYGLLEISIKGARKANSKSSSSTQLYSFSKLCINKGKNGYILNSAEPIKAFYNIRLDIKKFALSAYFCELILFTILPEQPCDVIAKLLLNTFHYLNSNERGTDFLKSVFELRLLSEIGLMPRLVGCAECCEYSCDEMYFYLADGKLLCKNCCDANESELIIKLDKTTLHIVRYIALSNYTKLFNFKISDKYQTKLSEITERYLTVQLNRTFQTLDFYKNI